MAPPENDELIKKNLYCAYTNSSVIDVTPELASVASCHCLFSFSLSHYCMAL